MGKTAPKETQLDQASRYTGYLGGLDERIINLLNDVLNAAEGGGDRTVDDRVWNALFDLYVAARAYNRRLARARELVDEARKTALLKSVTKGRKRR
jgi:hypothetical protein